LRRPHAVASAYLNGVAGVGADEFERAAFATATIFHGISDRYSSGLLHDHVTVSVTRPDWPVWS